MNQRHQIVEMAGFQHTRKLREYCDYIDEHLTKVGLAWLTLQKACKDLNVIYDDHLYWTIHEMIKDHDVSKMSVDEFIQYQRNFFPVDEEKDDSGFESALKHHYANNPHHWENWTKIEPHAPNELACHCVCMVCDWMAMSMKFGDTAEGFYKGHKDNFNLPQWADDFLEEIFGCLRKNEQ